MHCMLWCGHRLIAPNVRQDETQPPVLGQASTHAPLLTQTITEAAFSCSHSTTAALELLQRLSNNALHNSEYYSAKRAAIFQIYAGKYLLEGGMNLACSENGAHHVEPRGSEGSGRKASLHPRYVSSRFTQMTSRAWSATTSVARWASVEAGTRCPCRATSHGRDTSWTR